MPADLLLLHQGVVPNVNLAIAAGVAHRWNDRQLCFEPVLDEDFGSSVPGIAVAGDGAGIAGGTAAAERGRIAAIAAVRALKPEASCPIRRRCGSACSARRWAAPSSTGSIGRPKSSASPSGDTLVCRCEEVTAQQVRDTADIGCEGPNQMKAFLRCGMGPCQGRLCGLTVTELIADQRKTHAGRGRLLPPAPAGEADHAGRARLAADQRGRAQGRGALAWCAGRAPLQSRDHLIRPAEDAPTGVRAPSP